jgi:hypothetical protein
MNNSGSVMLGCRTADEDAVAFSMFLRMLFNHFRHNAEIVEESGGQHNIGPFKWSELNHARDAIPQVELLVQYSARKLLVDLTLDNVSVLRALRITNKFGGLFRTTGLVYDTCHFIRESPGRESGCKDILDLLSKEIVKAAVATFNLNPRKLIDWDQAIARDYQGDSRYLDETVIGGRTLTAKEYRSLDTKVQFLASVPDPSDSTSEDDLTGEDEEV